jgi:S-formylglutathione hydrolase FrmB
LALRRRLLLGSLAGGVLAAGGVVLARRKPAAAPVDRPRLVPGVVLRDLSFFSPALQRQMQYRVLMPAAATGKLPVVYLLHGGGGSFQDWTNYSDVAAFARDLLLIAPRGDYSYYTNAAARPQDRYEDYLLDDLPADVAGRLPARDDRAGRALVGVSMGGYGAVKAALRRPGHCGFVGALSAAIEVARRPFSLRRYNQSRAFEELFGPAGSATRRDNDPFALAEAVDPRALPYLHLTCGREEGLYPSNRDFADLLARRGIAHQFLGAPGGHNWSQWELQLPAVFASLRQHLGG